MPTTTTTKQGQSRSGGSQFENQNWLLAFYSGHEQVEETNGVKSVCGLLWDNQECDIPTVGQTITAGNIGEVRVIGHCIMPYDAVSTQNQQKGSGSGGGRSVTSPEFQQSSKTRAPNMNAPYLGIVGHTANGRLVYLLPTEVTAVSGN